jgi:hypothetical protein
MTTFAGLLLALAPVPVIENPVIEPIEDGSPLAICLEQSFRAQVPEGVIRPGLTMFTGPAIWQMASPADSVAEIVGIAPAGPRAGGRSYMTFSAWLETTDLSPWKREMGPNGETFRAAAFSNPVKVFDRALLQFIFDWDLTPCASML